MAETGQAVRRRRVFYIPGFDPFPPRRYRELYRKESAEQARLSGYDIRVSAGQNPNGWKVTSVIDGVSCEVDVEVLVWSDLVQQSMGHGIVATYAQLLRTSWLYVASGALRQLARLRKGPTIAALYPIATLLAELLVAVLIGWLFATIIADAVGRPLAAIGGLGVAWVILSAFRRIDRRIFAWYLMHDYAHSAANGGDYPKDLRARLGQFSDRVATALTESWDEVLVVGHSSGAHMAVTVLADIIRTGRVKPSGPALSLLTLGHVVPMISFLPAADGLRGDLRYLSARDELTWVDITAPGDGCAFALCDPVAVTGVAPDDQHWPLIVSAAFSQTLRPATWAALRRRYFRLHFQYLCAFDNLSGQPGEYDYFAITAGPQTLWQRMGNRKPSASRILTPLSPFRTWRSEAA